MRNPRIASYEFSFYENKPLQGNPDEYNFQNDFHNIKIIVFALKSDTTGALNGQNLIA